MSDRGLFVHEVFSAIQGEGRYVGTRQIFVRLMGCNIRCAYCDEPDALVKKPGTAQIEQTPGLRDFKGVTSPMSAVSLAGHVLRLNRLLGHGFVSLTGGEPLLQPEGLAELIPPLRDAGLRVSFETNGTRPEAVSMVAVKGDIVSLDIKLNSVDGEGVDPGIQRRFLEAALGAGADVYCKSVIGAETDEDELAAAVETIAEVEPGLTLYLQPVTPFGLVTKAPAPTQMLALQELAMSRLDDVRVVPQTHKLIGQK